jgi:hypothetical protein
MMQIRISRGAGRPVYIPAVIDGAVWETEVNAPGRFSCTLLDDPALVISEGNAISVTHDGVNVFSGFVFTRRYDHHGMIRLTAYDQLRYLKYRDTVVYDGITASSLLRRIAAAHPSLSLGAVADTRIRLEPRAEDTKPLLDVLRNALRETEAAGGGRFMLYDDFGRLRLRDTRDFMTDVLIGPDGGRTFTRTLSIDIDTYNHIRLICGSSRGRSVTTAGDPRTESEWGKLVLTERIADGTRARVKAAELLRQHNRVRREISVGGVPGIPAVRAGCRTALAGSLAGCEGSAVCTVERARHVWDGGGYTMDLEVTHA